MKTLDVICKELQRTSPSIRSLAEGLGYLRGDVHLDHLRGDVEGL
jgi:hypothetical protein